MRNHGWSGSGAWAVGTSDVSDRFTSITSEAAWAAVPLAVDFTYGAGEVPLMVSQAAGFDLRCQSMRTECRGKSLGFVRM